MNKSLMIKFSILVGAVFAIIVFLFTDAQRVSTEDYYLYAKAAGKRFQVYKDGGQYYLFLPSYIDDSDIELSGAAAMKNIHVLKSANISTVYITTQSRTMDNVYADKNHHESGKIQVYDAYGNLDYAGGLKYIKGHGNYSWNSEDWDKKPFGICLKKEASLLGLGRGQRYTLIANASDATLCRNHIARLMESRLGIPYAHTGEFVDLYINDEYTGNYYLCDDIEIGEERINISNLEARMDEIYRDADYDLFSDYETPDIKGRNLPTEPDDISGGYLFEREFIGRYELEYAEIGSGFETDSKECFVIKSPRICSADEINYIRALVEEIDEAIADKDGICAKTGLSYRDYIDLSSFAKRYLVEEVTKNFDAGNSSAYFYKDSDLIDSRLYYGPGWDYDMSMGNYQEWMQYDDPCGMTYAAYSDEANRWLKYLYDREDFKNLFIKEYQDELRPYIDQLLDYEIEDLRETLSASATMDALRWQNMYAKCGYDLDTQEEYQHLIDFIRLRSDYLKEEWIK